MTIKIETLTMPAANMGDLNPMPDLKMKGTGFMPVEFFFGFQAPPSSPSLVHFGK